MAKISQTPVKKAFYIDWSLTIVLLGLTLASLVAIYGAIPLMPNSSSDILIKQGVWIFLAVFSLVYLIKIDVDRLFTAIDIAYWVLIVLLVLLLMDRYINLPMIAPINGTRAWINLPGLGTLQPSEFMKAVLIIKTSVVIVQHHEKRGLPSWENDVILFFEVAKFAILPLFLIVMQPDTGIPIIIVIGLLTMLALSGIQKIWIIGASLAIVLVSIIFFGLFFFAQDILVNLVGSSYRLTRFYGWLQTEKYISSWGYQFYQSLLAVGSAGWWGHGWASKVISMIEPQNDFIFAVIGQNFGFVGASAVMFLQLSLDLIIIRILSQNTDYRDRIMVSGVLGMLLFQQIQNMGMILGLLPITGITLPFISSGGSSLLSYVPALAIIYQMSNTNTSRQVH